MNTSKIITNSKLCRTLTGLTSEKFQELVSQVQPLWNKVAYAKTPQKQRKHAVGAGRRYELSVAEAILLTLIHFRTYETLAFLGFLFNIDLSTAYRYLQRFEPLIDSLLDISKDQGVLTKAEILLIVDATEQETERRDGTGYSGKKRKQTIKTQVIASQAGRIRHISSSVPGNLHDKKLFDLTQLPQKIQQKMLADLGYLGTKCLLPKKSSKLHKLTLKQKRDNTKHSRLRVPIEHLFAHLKQWKILAHRFRSSLNNYNIIFRIVCGLRNMMMA